MKKGKLTKTIEAYMLKHYVIIPNLTDPKALAKLGYKFHKIKLRRIRK